jgi:hypothetical protein
MRLLALGAVGLLAACANPPNSGRSGFGEVVEVCEGNNCRLQPRAVVNPDLVSDAWQRRQEDPDAYRGESVAALREAAAAGDARAAHKLGQAMEFGPRNLPAAARAYQQAADAGLPFAQFRLATLAERGVVPGGRNRALELYLAAARGGVAQAAHNAAVMIQREQPGEALRLYTFAAENGVPEAQYNLALMSFRGAGIPRDPFGGVTWMRRAAQNGYLPAQRAAGRLYMTGLEEMGQDLNEARTWLSAAASRGDAESRRLLPRVERAAAAEAAQRTAFEREFALQREETRALWGAAALAAVLTPPPVVVVGW